jgi:hypothetical protein
MFRDWRPLLSNALPRRRLEIALNRRECQRGTPFLTNFSSSSRVRRA